MKRTASTLAYCTLFMLILIGVSSIARASPTINVTPKWWTIAPNQTQELILKNYEAPATGRVYQLYSIEVTRPGGEKDILYDTDYDAAVDIKLDPQDEVVIKYPDDWLSPFSGWSSETDGGACTASTADEGTYLVRVHGRTIEPWDMNTEWDVTEFSVVPEFTISVMVVLSLSFAGLLIFKRRVKPL